ncbi:transmembrane protein 81 [Ambystoma mexicanum]|uniref:transmembrane protein 81 n=1 Tax=Ambystoma mexicanum TaxID=8296 RepID=UPI0037E8C4BB
MAVAQGLLVCGVMTFALCSEPDQTVSIPPELQSVEAKVVVKSSGCSVTCGLGHKRQELCLVKPDGSWSDCEERMFECMISWDCGLQTFTVATGSPFAMNCFSSDTTGIGLQSFLYTWRYARGLITTNDALFRVYRIPEFKIQFAVTKEENAGTYRCDVLQLSTSKFIKRVYFGLKVISDAMVQLNFEKFHTTKEELKKLEDMPDDYVAFFMNKHFDVGWTFEYRVIFIGAVGIGSGLIVSCIIWAILRSFYNCLQQKRSGPKL